MMKYIAAAVYLFFLFPSGKMYGASLQTISIKDFGAKGNGVTNDQEAFEKASAFIRKQRGNVKLVIPTGTYLVGRQSKSTNQNAYLVSPHVLYFDKCNNLQIVGSLGTKIRFVDNLKFGSFNPTTGQARNNVMPFYDRSYIAAIGNGLALTNCTNVTISGIEFDGNNPNLIYGGPWGDVGTQVNHYGLAIYNSKNISVKNCHVHHFALDGMLVSSPGKTPDNITILDSKFEYNGRQGLSWVGGNGLTATNCSFSFTGKGKISSSPGAGVDIEAENGHTVQNGNFINCQFINNAGCGMVADTGPSKNMNFKQCTFWGVSNWSIWVRKPNYTFTKCNIYGSFVHGYVTTNLAEATKFYSCNFEDKFYKGQEVYGAYLAEIDGKKMMLFDKCTFTANKKKVIWYSGKATNNNEKALFVECVFNIKNTQLPEGDFYGIIRNAKLKNSNFKYYFPKGKKYYLGETNNLYESTKRDYINE